ncbi:PREDICTED: protein TIFY 5A [Nelumbo nucifera]|uniref:Protein TIFY n=1 Tax=Nelumbo nucifera TaxID=4432 RepID=A0A1U8B4T9_NELNU|nr:PREDICTED: protein TIFY 5A [Nelumbo nucifera]
MAKSTLPLALRRNCNLDLCLFPLGSRPSSDSDNSSLSEASIRTQRQQEQAQQQKQQQLTIFYNGRVCVCDVTDLQARAIICIARREMGERMTTPRSPLSPPLQSQLQSLPGLSMKRSLQRFLQKRKNRMQDASPYKH